MTVLLGTPQNGARAPVRRLDALWRLDDQAAAALESSISTSILEPPGRELVKEGQKIAKAMLVVSGLAARYRLLADGRRQLISFVLPGDLFGICHHPEPLAVSGLMSLTSLGICAAPSADISETLQHAYRVSNALEEAYLLAQITRLGRMSARERLLDLVLEIEERLALAGLAQNGRFQLPVTQETLSDALGLTPVHLNRTIQVVRREDDLQWRAGWITIKDPALLARKVGRVPTRVTAAR
ncbi:Crp/Fnr family transcriptional regulator [Croceibacterium sp. LX-88]|uniref:Crp/Fnr family transcriptional regulator n=1 Tax=Croceibacterium selenioxidans TaxID=2838833 RepID=A0ABS5W0P3_9SPHN|nr:Crp/Fnr family transcriptional regulator [Croceibacterium selenioxidans]